MRTFFPASFTQDFTTISPKALLEDLISQKLEGDWWKQWDEDEPDRRFTIDSAMDAATASVMRAFANGALPSYVHMISSGLFYLIPQDLWITDETSDWAIEYLDGYLLEHPFGASVKREIPASLADRPILIRSSDANDWLAGKLPAKPAAAGPFIPISKAALRKWMQDFGDQLRNLTDEEISKKAKAAFPEKRITRSLLRTVRAELDPGRKRGPKSLRH
jgi:hypothetical protein